MERAAAERWKTKYLALLETQERQQRHWELRLDLVRRGLSRSSLAAEGVDAAVDVCLRELRDLLRRNDGDADAELVALIPRLEKTVLDSEQRRSLRSRQAAEAFAELTRLLLTLSLPGEVRKALKSFAKRAAATAGQPGELPALLGEFSRLQGQALALEPQARRGLLGRLFGARPPAPALAGEALPTAEPEHLLASAADAAPPVHQAADPAYALPPLPEPGYSAIAPHLEATLLRLLDDLDLPERHRPQAELLRQRIQGSLNWYELVPVLDDLAVLVLTLNHAEQGDFQRYLQQLNQRLATFQAGLQALQAQGEDGAAQEQAFGVELQGQVNGLQSQLQTATDLDSLKQALDLQLEGLLARLAEQQGRREQHAATATQQLQALAARVVDMEREAQQQRGQIEEQRQKALRDALTGLPNRAAWSEQLEQAVAHWRHQGGDLLLAIFDVDLFKRVNDGYGHLAGDKVLKIIAQELQRRLRPSDFIARFGGEEFVLLLGDTPLAEGVTRVEQLRAAVAACPFHFRGERVVITLSAGLTSFAPGDDAERVFERADQALYRAKHAGRDRLATADDPA